jgi:hypothetical protein
MIFLDFILKEVVNYYSFSYSFFQEYLFKYYDFVRMYFLIVQIDFFVLNLYEIEAMFDFLIT